jgi:hypothetical protein
MSTQEYIDSLMKAPREATLKNSGQMRLGGLIDKLKLMIDKRKDSTEEEPEIRYDFEYLFPMSFSSWRGIYAELALDFYSSDYGAHQPLKLTEFYNMCLETVGKQFTGYKGGEYIMSRSTPIWIANHGNSGSTALIDVLDEDYQIILITGRREI